jgi:hypothetical protein
MIMVHSAGPQGCFGPRRVRPPLRRKVLHVPHVEGRWREGDEGLKKVPPSLQVMPQHGRES